MMELVLGPQKMKLMDQQTLPPQWPHWTGFEAPPTVDRRESPLGLQCRDKACSILGRTLIVVSGTRDCKAQSSMSVHLDMDIQSDWRFLKFLKNIT